MELLPNRLRPVARRKYLRRQYTFGRVSCLWRSEFLGFRGHATPAMNCFEVFIPKIKKDDRRLLEIEIIKWIVSRLLPLLLFWK